MKSFKVRAPSRGARNIRTSRNMPVARRQSAGRRQADDVIPRFAKLARVSHSVRLRGSVDSRMHARRAVISRRYSSRRKLSRCGFRFRCRFSGSFSAVFSVACKHSIPAIDFYKLAACRSGHPSGVKSTWTWIEHHRCILLHCGGGGGGGGGREERTSNVA